MFWIHHCIFPSHYLNRHTYMHTCIHTSTHAHTSIHAMYHSLLVMSLYDYDQNTSTLRSHISSVGFAFVFSHSHGSLMASTCGFSLILFILWLWVDIKWSVCSFYPLRVFGFWIIMILHLIICSFSVRHMSDKLTIQSGTYLLIFLIILLWRAELFNFDKV